MHIEAHAKINWSLDITGRRADGYHLMDMLMQPVTIADTVELTLAEELALICEGAPIPPSGAAPLPIAADEANLALRAAQRLKAHTGYPGGAVIRLTKRIPAGAGMGGGSADAAAVLAGLNRLWNLNLTQAELECVGLTLGADVPFCLRGGLTRTTGIGEYMQQLTCARTWWLVMLQPCEGLSTRDVFTAYHAEESPARPQTDAAQRALETGDAALLRSSLANVLQPVSERMRPPIAKAIDALKAQGAITALMTGSGSAVFGVFHTLENAMDACRALDMPSAFVCQTCDNSLTFVG